MLKYKSFILALFSLICFSLSSQNVYKIEGEVTDKETNEPLIGVNVIVQNLKQGTVTNENGYYILELKSGNYIITFSLVGYKSDTLYLNLKKKSTYNIALSQTSYNIESITFTGEKNKNIENAEIGSIKLTAKEFNSIPTVFGEKDPVKILQLTPGVQSAKEGFSGIYIRGGGADQNLFLLDDANAYNPSHLFGFFSVFNSDIIDNLKLVKAGMPAEYGGRLASVIEINTKDGDFNQPHVNAGIGLLSSKTMIEGPIINDKLSFYFAARRTYIDLLLKPFKNKFEESSNFFSTSTYYFSDLNGKLSFKINPNNHISITGYSGNDSYDFERKLYSFNSTIDWGNKLGSIKWNHVFNENFYMKNSISFTEYAFNFYGSQTSYSFTLNSFIQNINYKNKFTLLTNGHLLVFGTEYTKHKVKPGEEYAVVNETTVNFSDQNSYFGHESAIFASDNFDIQNFKFDIGIRYTNYTQVGPFEKYTSNIEGAVSDSVIIDKGEKMKNYQGFEPRISLRYLINSMSSIKLAYTQNYQYIHISPISTVSLPTDIWILSTKEIKPQVGTQYSAGYYQNIFQNNYEFSYELYLKKFNNLIEFTRNIFNDNSTTIEDRLFFGKGESYGMEVFLKKKYGKLTGWLGYTLSKSVRQFNEINFGKPFYAKYDRTHDFSIVSTYQLNTKFTFSGIFVYATGNAYTIPIFRYLIQGNVINYYSGINSFRLPAYHRMDISVSYTKHRNNKEITWDFSVYNLYNRKNPFYEYYEVKGSEKEKYLEVRPKIVSLFPILPSVTWNIKF